MGFEHVAIAYCQAHKISIQNVYEISMIQSSVCQIIWVILHFNLNAKFV